MRIVSIAILAALGCGGDPAASDPALALLGGDTTVFDETDEAFSYAARNLSDALRASYQLGDGIFNRNWVTAPATPSGNDGLGPTYNALSCAACHVGKGRGAPPSAPDEPFLGLLLRLSVPGADAHGGPMPDPHYGGQFNHRSILGVPSEGAASLSYAEEPGHYGDGEPYSLRRPTYAFPALSFGPLGTGIMVSPRLAPQVIGLGLLEAVGEDTIRGFADAHSRRGDAIRGRPNQVWDPKTQRTVMGRFGWKANQPGVEQQTLGAFLGDIGITSSLFPNKNCPPAQTACAAAPQSLSQPNLSDLKAEAMTRHGRTIAVPARRRLDDPAARLGEALFEKAQCGVCHVARMTTGAMDGYPELSRQTIRPFTDLLLHDLGDDLADGRPDFLATGREWRTPPLWGMGLLQTVDGHTFLLHDGRARGFAEAILWHGGEAAAAKEAFRAMKKSDRDALIAFLQSL